MQSIRATIRGHRRAVRRISLACALLAATVAVFIGIPFALLATSRIGHADWLTLGNVGQAYGGVAATFGVLALIGVVKSLQIQHRDSAANRELIQRTIHGNLLAKSVDDPELLACWGPPIHSNETCNRQDFYTNQVVSFWRSMFEIGMITETQLRTLAERMFSNDPGRRYWSFAGNFRHANYTSRIDIEFFEIMENAYRRTSPISTSKEPEISQIDCTEQLRPKRGTRYSALMVVLAAIAAASGVVLAAVRRHTR